MPTNCFLIPVNEYANLYSTIILYQFTTCEQVDEPKGALDCFRLAQVTGEHYRERNKEVNRAK